MGTANEAELGLGIGVFPDDGVVVLDPLQLGIVNDIDLCTFGDETGTQFLCFGFYTTVINVILSKFKLI